MFSSSVALWVDLNALLLHTWDFFSGGHPAFEITSIWLFWFAFATQLVAQHTMTTLTINFDVLVFGYMQQICAQIEILKHNIVKISMLDNDYQYRAIVRCIKLHNDIYRYILDEFLYIILF